MKTCDLNVLMFGTGYFPRRTAGDKNFFVDLVSALRSRLGGLAILSVNDGPSEPTTQDTPGGPVPIWNVRRALCRGNPERYFHEAGGTWSYHHHHRPLREAIERQLTVASLRRRLVDLTRSAGVDVVHFIDNFGPAMPWIRQQLPGVAVTATALRYDPRGKAYRHYIGASFRGLDGVACLTDAYRGILAAIGVRAETLATLRWGPAPSFAVSPARRDAVTQHFGLATEAPLFLWTGFLQQVAAESLHESAALARALVGQAPDLHFAFVFKPESWRDEFRALAGERIHVEAGSADFLALLARADCLVSPVVRTGSTVAPPLTWIEAMALGTPVATTAALGVDETVTSGENGIVAPTTAALEAPLLQLLSARTRLAALGERAADAAARRFALPAIADGYVDFFAASLRRRQGALGNRRALGSSR